MCGCYVMGRGIVFSASESPVSDLRCLSRSISPPHLCRGSQAQIGPSHFIYYLECEGCQSIRQPATMIHTPHTSQICILVTRFTIKPHHQLILPACSYLESVQESSDLIAIHTFHTQSIQIQHIKYKQQQVTKLFFLALSFLEQPQAFRFRNFR